MMNSTTQCSDLRLRHLIEGDESNPEYQSALQHVDSCASCQARLEQLAADSGVWQEARDVLTSADSVEPAGSDSPANRWRHSNWQRRPVAWNETMARHLLSPPSHPEMLGRIGRYDVERLVGSGGMGVVFKAWDTELNRPVAVKLLAPYQAENGSARKRFAREARAAAAVVDEHVVAIHNVESGDDPEKPPFLVMKYIAGGSLQQRLDRDGPLDVCEILRIGMQTARGLAAAHAQGLIHRDVKPSNILLDEGVERALLTDFGLARAEDDACLTRSGFHPGTPHYMSPEQVRGEAIDSRSDLFSLGCVLYALCTGHPPFRAETSYAVLRRITDDTARPIRELSPNIPEWLEQIVMKLLSKSREDRFDSAEQVAELLEDCLAHMQHPTIIALPEFKALETSGRGNPIYYVIEGIFLMISRRSSAAVSVAAIMIVGITVMLFPDFHRYDISGTVWETIGETDLPSSFKGWDGSVVMGDPTGRNIAYKRVRHATITLYKVSPIPEVNAGYQFEEIDKFKTDGKGRFSFDIPEQLRRFIPKRLTAGETPDANWEALLLVTFSAPGLATYSRTLETNDYFGFVPLLQGTSISGRLIDEQGRPLVGAQVTVNDQSRAQTAELNTWLEQTSSIPLPKLEIAPGEREALMASRRPANIALHGLYWIPTQIEGTTTDNEGRFTIDGIGPDDVLQLKAECVGYLKTSIKVIGRDVVTVYSRDPFGSGENIAAHGRNFTHAMTTNADSFPNRLRVIRK